ncbi:tail fiber protein [Serratia sp. DD3]|uniref:tail fiber protein n=1 Tax=Serratia sp. DD3 TaxID=1410619 RepID=UPI0003C52592|nr:tail fiber protein [Serratia sp. DD3]KEY56930.1 phage tail collar domain protein [Serratia sp. DD3]
MAKNEFLPFGTAGNANVLSNTEYQSLAARRTGFQSGVAKSRELNTAWRQSSVIASVVAQFIADNSGNDVLDNGDLAVVQSSLRAALNKLYLQSSDGSVLPIGTPIPWPTSVPPVGWLKCNGSTFNTSLYPLLALAYPSGVLPDLRGEFIRGWDDGRGVDAGRVMLSTQSDAIGLMTATNGMAINEFFVSTPRAAQYPATDSIDGFMLGESFGDETIRSVSRARYKRAVETRSRNVTFNYIVRAA